MSATEELSSLLDERGVEWKDGDAAYEIEWSTSDGRHCSAMYWKPTFTVLVSGCTPEQAIAATLGKPSIWRTSYEQESYDRWYNSLQHGEPSNLAELIEDVIWTTLTVDLGPNGNTCQGVDEGEVHTDGLINWWAEKAAKLGGGECEFVDDSDGEPAPPKCNSCGYDPGIYECAWLDDGTYEYERNYCPNCGRKVKR